MFFHPILESGTTFKEQTKFLQDLDIGLASKIRLLREVWETRYI